MRPRTRSDSPAEEGRPRVRDALKEYRRTISLVDLFAGIGGFHYGIGAASADMGLGIDPLLVSEIEPSCQEVYRANHACDVHGDINSLPLGDFRSVSADFVTAGFPCQPFSNSGRKLGLKDPRGRFYSRIEEIIKHFTAKAFILENVPGMTKNGGGSFDSDLALVPQKIGKTMRTLERNILDGLGDYDVQWLEVDSSKLGSPQVRRRVYIIGLHKDFGGLPDLSPISCPRNPFVSIMGRREIPELELSANQARNIRSFMTRPPSYKDGMRRVGKAYLCEGGNVGQGYHAHGLVPTLTKVWARFLPIYFPDHRENIPEVDVREFHPGRHYGKGYLRRASVEEVMALQGFPTSFVPHESSPLAYEHAGNAVNALVVQDLARRLLDRIRH